MATLEVFNAATGRTTVFVGGPDSSRGKPLTDSFEKEGSMTPVQKAFSLSLIAALGVAAPAAAAPQVTCRSFATRIKAVSLPGNHNIFARFQLDTPNLQLLMSTTVIVGGVGPSCLVADLSALTRITDNYVVYQVRVDGVPMEGQVGG